MAFSSNLCYNIQHSFAGLGEAKIRYDPLEYSNEVISL